MENNNEHNIKKGHFDAFVHAVGSEIEQAQVRLITAEIGRASCRERV